MSNVKEQALDGRKILIYVAFVLLVLATVFAFDLIQKSKPMITAQSIQSISQTQNHDESDDFEDEAETVSQSMIG